MIEERPTHAITVRVSYLEIYNESLFDLLSTLPYVGPSATPMTIVENPQGVFIKGLSVHLTSQEEVSSCSQSFPASGSFAMSWIFASGSQSIRASTSILPMNIQGGFPFGFTDLISLQSKGLSRVFSNTTVQKHQFVCAQLSL